MSITNNAAQCLVYQLNQNKFKFTQARITINGLPFDHLLYHYRLAYSGWQYVQVIQGGESFVALAEGLQNALEQCGGSPKLHRTDS